MKECLKIDSEQIYIEKDDKSVSDWIKDLICAICHNIVCCPVNISTCAHLFCRSCLSQWCKSPTLKFSLATCPVCRTALSKLEDYDVNSYIQNKVDQLQVRCPNFNQGCMVLLPLKQHGNEIQNHLHQCEFTSYDCPYCSKSLLVKEKKVHLEVCPNYTIKCQYCSMGFKQAEYKHHLASPQECLGLIGCQNECGNREMDDRERETLHIALHDHSINYIAVEEIWDHLMVCPNRKIECPSCGLGISFLQLETHLEENFLEEKHKKYLFSLWKKELEDASLDEQGIGRVCHVGDHRFYQTKNSKWIPIKITKSYRSYEAQEIPTAATEEKSFALSQLTRKKSSQLISRFTFSPSRCHRRILAFEKGFEKFLIPSSNPPLTLGAKVLGIRNLPFLPKTTKIRNGIITSIDNQQVCINATEWYHQQDVRLCTPCTSEIPNIVKGCRPPNLENFWGNITSAENIRGIQTLKRRRLGTQTRPSLPYFDQTSL